MPRIPALLSFSPDAASMLPIPPHLPSPISARGPTSAARAHVRAQRQPGSAWVCPVSGSRGECLGSQPQLLVTILVTVHAGPWAGSLGLGTPAHSLSPPLPSALDFQTESKMGSHQVRFVFFQSNFPFIDKPSLGRPCPPSSVSFFPGYLGMKSWWLFLSPVVSSPAGHSFRMSPESQWLP